jgi:hypothetical protein
MSKFGRVEEEEREIRIKKVFDFVRELISWLGFVLDLGT